MDYLKEIEGKRLHDPHNIPNTKMSKSTTTRCIWVPGAIIVGAGPSGLATAACLKQKGIKSLILERDNCIASLWQLKTYDRLRLHLPKQLCELPLMPFPSNFPTYPTKQQFVSYLTSYANHFDLNPIFNNKVIGAEFDDRLGYWRIKTSVVGIGGIKKEERKYFSKWLIVATGENAQEIIPEIEGLDEFKGTIVHTSCYRRGELFRRKRVLVIGCGNSGMEVCLDLCNYDAFPSLVVRDTVHILPQEMLGRSTFSLSMCLLKWLPIRLVDQFLLLISRLKFGDTARLGLTRPKLGPLELKTVTGKTPVLDVGTLAHIKSGKIQVCKGVKRLTSNSAEFVDGKIENFDAIILATGYKSNVPSWLKDTNMFNENDGMPRKPYPNGWKGQNGLYAVGFTNRGLLGASLDARTIAQDIEIAWQKYSSGRVNV